MKTSSLLLLLLPLLISTVTIKASRVLLDDDDFEDVHDTSGNDVKSGQEYYILPVIRGSGGGVTVASTRNGSCPLDVVQDQNEVSNGLPLIFTPVDPTEDSVDVSTDLNIKFSALTRCAQSTVWQLSNTDESTGQRFVTTGGVEGNPGRSTLNNWFKIDRYEDAYKLYYCPTVCDICRPQCGNIGIYIGGGERRLALSDQPFKVVFKKV